MEIADYAAKCWGEGSETATELRQHAAASDAKDAEIERLKSELIRAQNYIWTRPGAGGEIDHLKAENARLAAVVESKDQQLTIRDSEVTFLGGLVARLPKTEDGFPVAPVDTVFHLSDGGTITDVSVHTAMNWTNSKTKLRKCFSTREAAEAAKETQ
jgi:hypothetical protein